MQKIAIAEADAITITKIETTNSPSKDSSKLQRKRLLPRKQARHSLILHKGKVAEAITIATDGEKSVGTAASLTSRLQPPQPPRSNK